MSTTKIHYALYLTFPYRFLKGSSPVAFSKENAAKLCIPDAIRVWTGDRIFSHCTINPSTKKVSGIRMPLCDTKEWVTKEMVQCQTMVNAGRIGHAVVDEPTIPSAFWILNDFSIQNFIFYLHLVQDSMYDKYLWSVLDFSKRYEKHPTFLFNGKSYSASEVRGEGEARWKDNGLLNQIDSQVFVRVAKCYFEETGIKMNKKWIEEEMKPSFFSAYSQELAEHTTNCISFLDIADDIITSGDFDRDCWDIPNPYVDMWITWIMNEMYNAFIQFFPYLILGF